MTHESLEANLREMEQTRERYWRRYPATSPTKLRLARADGAPRVPRPAR